MEILRTFCHIVSDVNTWCNFLNHFRGISKDVWVTKHSEVLEGIVFLCKPRLCSFTLHIQWLLPLCMLFSNCTDESTKIKYIFISREFFWKSQWTLKLWNSKKTLTRDNDLFQKLQNLLQTTYIKELYTRNLIRNFLHLYNSMSVPTFLFLVSLFSGLKVGVK